MGTVLRAIDLFFPRSDNFSNTPIQARQCRHRQYTISSDDGIAPKTGLITSRTDLLMAELRNTNATSRVDIEDEDWETDLDFTATCRVGGFKQLPITFAPHP